VNQEYSFLKMPMSFWHPDIFRSINGVTHQLFTILLCETIRWKRDSIQISHKAINDLSGIRPRQITRSMDKLAELGWIEITGRPGYAKVYTLTENLKKLLFTKSRSIRTMGQAAGSAVPTPVIFDKGTTTQSSRGSTAKSSRGTPTQNSRGSTAIFDRGSTAKSAALPQGTGGITPAKMAVPPLSFLTGVPLSKSAVPPLSKMTGVSGTVLGGAHIYGYIDPRDIERERLKEKKESFLKEKKENETGGSTPKPPKKTLKLKREQENPIALSESDRVHVKEVFRGMSIDVDKEFNSMVDYQRSRGYKCKSPVDSLIGWIRNGKAFREAASQREGVSKTQEALREIHRQYRGEFVFRQSADYEMLTVEHPGRRVSQSFVVDAVGVDHQVRSFIAAYASNSHSSAPKTQHNGSGNMDVATHKNIANLVPRNANLENTRFNQALNNVLSSIPRPGVNA